VTYIQNANSLQVPLDAVENLDPFDILVADKSWQQRDLLTLDESRMLWAIITAWQKKDISSTEALAWLDNNELLDPDALMMGFAAFQTAAAQNPPPPPSPLPPLAPGMRSEPSRELLEAIADRRVA
jgi:hypothetical protein